MNVEIIVNINGESTEKLIAQSLKAAKRFGWKEKVNKEQQKVDAEGNLIFEEIRTPILDENQEPVLDELGNPTYTITQGDPTMETVEVNNPETYLVCIGRNLASYMKANAKAQELEDAEISLETTKIEQLEVVKQQIEVDYENLTIE